LDHGQIVEIWFSHDKRVREHDWAKTLAATQDAEILVPGFGSTDCKVGCEAHLIHFNNRPVTQVLRFDMHQRYPEHKPIYVELVAPWDRVMANGKRHDPKSLLDVYLRGRVYLESRRRAAYDGLEEVQRQERLANKTGNSVGAKIMSLP